MKIACIYSVKRGFYIFILYKMITNIKLISTSITLHKLINSTPKNQQTNLKMDREPGQMFLSRRCTNGQQIYKMMLNFTIY